VKELDFQHKLDKKIKAMYKKMKAKKIRDEEKARKAADKAARKAATDAKRTANRRAKRQRDRDEAAEAAAAAGTDDTGALEEEVCLFFSIICILLALVNSFAIHCSQSTVNFWMQPDLQTNLQVLRSSAGSQPRENNLNLLGDKPSWMIELLGVPVLHCTILLKGHAILLLLLLK
jgi:hypothetical protein